MAIQEQGDAVLAALNGLANGFAKAIEHRQQVADEDRKFELQQREVELRAQERQTAQESNDLYRKAMIGQSQQKVNLEGTKVGNDTANTIQDNVRDAESRRLKAQADIDKANRDRQGWVKKEALLKAQADSGNTQAKALYDAAVENRTNIDDSITNLSQQRDQAAEEAKQLRTQLPANRKAKGVATSNTAPTPPSSQADSALKTIAAASTYDEALQSVNDLVNSPGGPKPGSPDFIKLQTALTQKKQSVMGQNRRSTPPAE